MIRRLLFILKVAHGGIIPGFFAPEQFFWHISIYANPVLRSWSETGITLATALIGPERSAAW